LPGHFCIDGESRFAFAVGVASSGPEQPLAAVPGAVLRRRLQCCRNAVAHAFHVSGDDIESVAQMSGDVLAEDDLGLALPDDTGKVGPKVAGVVDAEPLAGVAERLARVTSSDDIHASTPRSSVERLDVTPDRRRIHGAVFHTRSQYRGSIGFPFDVTHDASRCADCKADTEFEPSNPGT
jgi:hypothetical protein